jgi:3-oxoacyl-[acyl-carrier protein] reductase
MQLINRIALITGAGRGIGRAIAECFAVEGCDVALMARSADELQTVAERIRGMGRRALVLPCDVRQEDRIKECVAVVHTELGPVDILVNNAGFAKFGTFPELTTEDWENTFQINLMGSVHCTRAVLPSMMARRRGHIVFVSSVAGLKGIERQTAYCASKHAVLGLTKALALEMRPYGVAVHALCPGGVITRLAEEAMPERDKSDWMEPQDIAHAALFLVTQHPRATTDILTVRRFAAEPL